LFFEKFGFFLFVLGKVYGHDGPLPMETTAQEVLSLLISLMSDIAAGKYMYLPAPGHFLGEEVVWMFSHLTCMD
jgi:hypothetical protein